MTSVPALAVELLPCPDPWDVAQQLAHYPYLLFLDSADRHSERGRYSYVMADPVDWITDTTTGLLQLQTQFRERINKKSDPNLPPFQGGFAGLLGYGLARTLERLPEPQSDEFGVPDLAIGRYEWVVAFDHRERRSWLIVNRKSHRLMNRIFHDLQSTLPPEYIDYHSKIDRGLLREFPSGLPGVSSNFSRDDYLAKVQRVIEYIHAGDAFQVNLSQRLLAPLTEHPLELYGRLRERSPSPYGCYFDLGEFKIASASPEQFLKVSADGEVVTRPIKGTRPRGWVPEEDAARLLDLTTDDKDRAENVMIVDLLRNDLGRVCEYGSVRVPKVCEVETYNYVHHLVSEVRGKLRAGLTPFDLLNASFPGGSVTGAPKVRAMEIIAELEPTARGPYCGSVGFVGFDGAMDSNILIRTFTAGRGWLQFPVGGGIVADSIPEREYEETLHKAAGLLRARTMILEGLVTTLTTDGSPHLAPMGPRMGEYGDTFLLRPFPTSTTFLNLKRHPEGVLHVTDDVLLLAKAAVGKVGKFPDHRDSEIVRGIVLEDACRYFEFRATSIDESEARVRIECQIVKSGTGREFFGFNRAKHAVLEAAILATRFHILPAEEIESEYRKLRVIVDKTAGPQERKAMAFLEREWANYREREAR